MTRRKKPPVSVSRRREWLRQYEEDGKTPPEIAKADNYDVRTVRKQLDITRQEREEREASVIVLRDVKKQHYGDLVSYAEKMDGEIQQPSLPFANDRLYIALHEHIPRSPLWKGLDKLKDLNEAIHNIEISLNQAAVNLINKESNRVFNKELRKVGLDIEGTSGALVYSIKQPEGSFSPNITDEKAKEGFREIRYGPWNCGVVPDNQVADVKKFIGEMMSSKNFLPDSEELKDKLKERHKVIEMMREELATIIMKRIVPGRCKYCPF